LGVSRIHDNLFSFRFGWPKVVEWRVSTAPKFAEKFVRAHWVCLQFRYNQSYAVDLLPRKANAEIIGIFALLDDDCRALENQVAVLVKKYRDLCSDFDRV